MRPFEKEQAKSTGPFLWVEKGGVEELGSSYLHLSHKLVECSPQKGLQADDELEMHFLVKMQVCGYFSKPKTSITPR